MYKLTLSVLLAAVMILTGCMPAPAINPTNVPPSGQPTGTKIVIPTQALPTQANTPVPTTITSSTPSQSATPGSTGLPALVDLGYLDDRSTPAALMLSYLNAINKHSYLQAYSYYSNAAEIGTLDEFTSSNSNTQFNNVAFGQISSEGAAGSIYFSVPMVIQATTSTGQEKLSACYVLRLPQPGNYGAPPITPLHIERGMAQSVPMTTPDSDALATACSGPDYPTGPNNNPAELELLSDLSSANYIDNRSGPVEVISSLMNAINRKEFVRAYSYWQTPAQEYEPFAAGYAHTASVTAQFGTATPDAGAGQVYYSLPVVLQATLDNGTLQTFSACYTLHLSQPGFQATPPFEPLGIVDANAEQVDNNIDVPSTLAAACQ